MVTATSRTSGETMDRRRCHWSGPVALATPPATDSEHDGCETPCLTRVHEHPQDAESCALRSRGSASTLAVRGASGDAPAWLARRNYPGIGQLMMSRVAMFRIRHIRLWPRCTFARSSRSSLHLANERGSMPERGSHVSPPPTLLRPPSITHARSVSCVMRPSPSGTLPRDPARGQWSAGRCASPRRSAGRGPCSAVIGPRPSAPRRNEAQDEYEPDSNVDHQDPARDRDDGNHLGADIDDHSVLSVTLFLGDGTEYSVRL